MTNAGLATEPGHGVIVANDGISTAPTRRSRGQPELRPPGGRRRRQRRRRRDARRHHRQHRRRVLRRRLVDRRAGHASCTSTPRSCRTPACRTRCYFKLVGDAPGASLVDTNSIDTPESVAGDPLDAERVRRRSAAIDAAVLKAHADVINESYGYSNSPGSYVIHYAANDAAVDAGVTVVASSGDSGVQGTVSSPASDPKIIAAGATNTLRLNAMAYGFAGWVNDDITPLSSGGTTPDNKLVDLVAPGYGGEAACNPHGSDCPTNTQTEAFGGTSESSPLIAGAAADVIQAYRDSHNGDSPSPALVKQLLVSTATRRLRAGRPAGRRARSTSAPRSQAAQQTPNTTVTTAPATNGLVLDPDPAGPERRRRLDELPVGAACTTRAARPTTVTGTFRELGPEHQIGDDGHRERQRPGSRPPRAGRRRAGGPGHHVQRAGRPRPARRRHDLAGPDQRHDPQLHPHRPERPAAADLLRLRHRRRRGPRSAPCRTSGTSEVANPEAGTWKAQIKWANGRAHLQSLPNVPGTYTGTVSFQASGAELDHLAGRARDHHRGARSRRRSRCRSRSRTRRATTPSRCSSSPPTARRPRSPIARRTLIPSTGGEFDTQITSSVGRGIGQISTFNVNVPAGRADLGVTVTDPGHERRQPDDAVPGQPVRASRVDADQPDRRRRSTARRCWRPPSTSRTRWPGTWEIDVELNLTTSGKEFRQTVVGDVLPQAPAITSPADGSTLTSTTPVISGTGMPGDTVTVVERRDGGLHRHRRRGRHLVVHPGAGPAGRRGDADRHPGRPDGQPVGGLGAGRDHRAAGVDEHPGHGVRHDAGDAGAHARRARLVRRVHAGRRQDLHGVHHGQRGQLGGRRDAERLRPPAI